MTPMLILKKRCIGRLIPLQDIRVEDQAAREISNESRSGFQGSQSMLGLYQRVYTSHCFRAVRNARNTWIAGYDNSQTPRASPAFVSLGSSNTITIRHDCRSSCLNSRQRRGWAMYHSPHHMSSTYLRIKLLAIQPNSSQILMPITRFFLLLTFPCLNSDIPTFKCKPSFFILQLFLPSLCTN